MKSFAGMLVAALAPMLLATPAGPLDGRRRYYLVHRPVGTPRALRTGVAIPRRLKPRKLSGARGLR